MPAIKDYRIRLELDLKDLDKALGGIPASFKKTMDSVKAAVVSTEQDVRRERAKTAEEAVKADQRAASESQKVNQERAKGAKEQSDAVRKANEEIIKGLDKVKKASADEAKVANGTNDEIKAARARRIKAEIELEASKEDKIEAELNEELKNNLDNFDKIQKARERAAKQAAASQKKQANLAKQLSRATKPTEGIGPINRGNVELGENLTTVIGGLKKGDIAGVAASFGGLRGGIAGAGVDILTGAIRGFANFAGEAQEKARAVNNQFELLANTLNIDIDSSGFRDLEIQLKAIDIPLGRSREEIIKFANSAAGFADKNEIPQVVADLTNLDQIGGQLSESFNFDQTITNIGALADAGVDTSKAMDVLATTAINLRGKSLDPVGEAGKKLGEIYAFASTTIDDSNAALNQGAGAFLALTESGLKAKTAVSSVTGLFEGLKKGSTDPKTIAAIQKQLPEGLSLLDIGLEKGNVSQEKFFSFLETNAESGAAVVKALGGTAERSINLMQAAFQNTGKSIGDFISQIENSSGAAAKNAALLEPVRDVVERLNDQYREDAIVEFGDKLTGVTAEAEKGFNSLLSTVLTADFNAPFLDAIPGGQLLADGLESVRDLFVDTEVRAEQALGRFEKIADVNEAVQDLTTSLTGIEDGQQKIDETLASMEQLKNVSPAAAAEIERLATGANATDPSNLQEIDLILQEIADSQAFETIQALNEAITASNEAVDTAISNAETWQQSLADVGAGILDAAGDFAGFFADISGAGLILENTFDVSIGDIFRDGAEALGDLAQDAVPNFRDQMQSAQDVIAENRDRVMEINAAIESGTLSESEQNELLRERRELNQEISGERERLVELQSGEQELVDSLTRQLENQVEAQRVMAESMGDTFDEAMALETAIQEMGDSSESARRIFDQMPDILDTVKSNIVDAAGAAEDLAGATEEAVTTNEDLQAAFESGNSILDERQKTLQAMGVTVKKSKEDELAALDVQKEVNNAILTELEAKLALTDANTLSERESADVLAEIEQRNQNILRLKEDQARVAAGGEAEGGLQEVQTAAPSDDFEAQRAAIQEQINGIKKMNAAIDETSANLRAEIDADNEKRRDASDQTVESAEREAQARGKNASEINRERAAFAKSVRESRTSRSSETRSIRETNKARKDSVEDFASKLKGIIDNINKKATEFVASAAGQGAEIISGIFGGGSAQERIRAQLNQQSRIEAQLRSEADKAIDSNTQKINQNSEQWDNVGDSILAADEKLDELQKQLERAARGVDGAFETLDNALTAAGSQLSSAFRGDSSPDQVVSRLKDVLDALPTVGERRGQEFSLGGVDINIPQLEQAYRQALEKIDLEGDLRGAQSILADVNQQVQRLRQQGDVSTAALDVIRRQIGAAEEAREQLNENQSAIDDSIDATNDQTNAIKESTEAAIDLTKPAETILDVLRSAAIFAEELKGTGKELADLSGISDVEFGFELGDFRKSVESLIGPFGDIESRAMEVRDAFLELGAANIGKSLDDVRSNAELAEQALNAAISQLAPDPQAAADLRSLFDQLALGVDKLGETTQAFQDNQAQIAMNEQQLNRLRMGTGEFISDLESLSEQFQQEQIPRFFTNLQREQARFADKTAELQTLIGTLQDQVKQKLSLGFAVDDDEVLKLQKEIAELERVQREDLPKARQQAFGEAAKDDIEKIAAGIQSATAVAGQAVDGFIAMQEAIESGDAGAIVDTGIDITRQIGEALLGSGIPQLKLAGAIIVGAAMIAKAVKQIIELFVQPQRTALELAQRAQTVEQENLALMEKRKNLTDKLIALGDRSVDQAKEQLALLKEQQAALESQSDVAAMFANQSAEQLAVSKEQLDTEESSLEAQLSALEFALEGSRAERVDLLESMGIDPKQNTKKQIRELIEETKTGLAEVGTQQDSINNTIETRIALLELEKEIIEEEIQLNQLRLRLGADESEVLAENAELRRQALESALESLAPGSDLSAFSDEQLQNFLKTLADAEDSQIGPEIQELAEAWLDSVDAVDAYNQQLMAAENQADDLFDRQRRILELQRDLNEISDKTYRKEIVDLLQDRLELLEAERETLLANNASQAELLDNEIARKEIELEIKGIIDEQTGALKQEDSVLNGLIRKLQARRRELLLSGGGAIGAAGQAELGQTRDEIEQRLIELGFSESEIENFIKSLPGFAAGGPAGFTGAAMLHGTPTEPEFIVSSAAVKRLGLDNLQALNEGNPLSLETSETAKAAFMNVVNNFSLSVGSINNTIQGAGDPGAVAGEITRTTADALMSLMSRGIQEGMIDTNRR